MILTRIPKRDLKSCRLAIKAWEGLIVPLLFDSVFVTARYAELEVADRVASRFGDFVETLIYSAEFFGDLAVWDIYRKYTALKRSVLSMQPCHERHLAQHRQTYTNLAREQSEILKDGKMQKHLFRVFKRLPRISKIVFTHSSRKRELDWCEQAALDAKARSHEPFDTTFTCSDKNCNFPAFHQYRSDHCTHAFPGRQALDQGASHWMDLMKAVGESGIVVREIRAVAPLRDTMPINIWRPSCGLGEVMINTFTTLTKLQLSLDLDYYEDLFQGINEYPLVSEVLSKALSSATNLESLHISLSYATWGHDIRKHYIDFGTLFKDCWFPKLNKMSLHRCGVDEEEVLSFLKRSPAVQSLVLKDLDLIGGYWTTMVQDIRDTTRVKDLQLLDIRGSMGDSEGDDVEDYEVGERGLESDVQELFNRQKGSRISNAELKSIVEKRWMETIERAKN